jgi:hypothetical protein
MLAGVPGAGLAEKRSEGAGSRFLRMAGISGQVRADWSASRPAGRIFTFQLGSSLQNSSFFALTWNVGPERYSLAKDPGNAAAPEYLFSGAGPVATLGVLAVHF